MARLRESRVRKRQLSSDSAVEEQRAQSIRDALERERQEKAAERSLNLEVVQERAVEDLYELRLSKPRRRAIIRQVETVLGRPYSRTTIGSARHTEPSFREAVDLYKESLKSLEMAMLLL